MADHTSHSTPSRLLVTKSCAEFVHSLDFRALDKTCIAKLKELVLDYIGVASGAAVFADSSLPFYNGVVALVGPESGKCTAFTKGSVFAPQYAALLNGAFGHTLDFDDTYAPGALHPGVSVISAALAQAEADPSVTPAHFLTALAAGYEIVCRVAVALGGGSYARGFHNTATAGIFGAIAAISKLKNLETLTIENAFGLAASKAAGTMQWLENGAWNKRLHPGFAAHDGFVCVAFAEAGVIGAAQPLEGKFGLFHGYTTQAHPENVTESLGVHWTFLDTAVKPFPACRMTHGSIELAAKFASAREHEPVKQIIVEISEHCFPIVGLRVPNKVHPKNVVDAQFSSYYQVAVAWLRGSATGWNAYDFLNDSAVKDLCEKVTVQPNTSFTGLENSLKVIWEDGEAVYENQKAPIGEKDNPLSWEQLQNKFFLLAKPAFGERKSKEVAKAVADLENVSIREIMTLLK